MEKYIISYLEAINEEFVNIQGTARLTKTTTNTKGAIKVDNIKMSVIDGIKKQNINLDERKIGELLDSVVDNIEKNHEMFLKIYDIYKMENPYFTPYTEQLPTSVKLNTEN